MNDFIFVGIDDHVGEYVDVFDYRKYLDDIGKTYKYNKKNIIKQFLVDAPRTDIYIGNRLLKKYKILLETNVIVLLLMCQSSLSYPMEKITEHHKIDYVNSMLVDYSNSKTTVYLWNSVMNIKKRLKIIKPVYEDGVFIKMEDKYFVDINLSLKLDKCESGILMWSVKYIT